MAGLAKQAAAVQPTTGGRSPAGLWQSPVPARSPAVGQPPAVDSDRLRCFRLLARIFFNFLNCLKVFFFFVRQRPTLGPETGRHRTARPFARLRANFYFPYRVRSSMHCQASRTAPPRPGGQAVSMGCPRWDTMQDGKSGCRPMPSLGCRAHEMMMREPSDLYHILIYRRSQEGTALVLLGKRPPPVPHPPRTLPPSPPASAAGVPSILLPWPCHQQCTGNACLRAGAGAGAGRPSEAPAAAAEAAGPDLPTRRLTLVPARSQRRHAICFWWTHSLDPSAGPGAAERRAGPVVRKSNGCTSDHKRWSALGAEGGASGRPGAGSSGGPRWRFPQRVWGRGTVFALP